MQPFVLARRTFEINTFSKQLIFRRTYLLALIFYRGTVAIKFSWEIYFFQNTTYSRSFLILSNLTFYLKRAVAVIYSFKATVLMHRRDSFLHSGWLLYGANNFWQQLIILRSYFFERAFLSIQLLKNAYLFHHLFKEKKTILLRILYLFQETSCCSVSLFKWLFQQ